MTSRDAGAGCDLQLFPSSWPQLLHNQEAQRQSIIFPPIFPCFFPAYFYDLTYGQFSLSPGSGPSSYLSRAPPSKVQQAQWRPEGGSHRCLVRCFLQCLTVAGTPHREMSCPGATGTKWREVKPVGQGYKAIFTVTKMLNLILILVTSQPCQPHPTSCSCCQALWASHSPCRDVSEPRPTGGWGQKCHLVV